MKKSNLRYLLPPEEVLTAYGVTVRINPDGTVDVSGAKEMRFESETMNFNAEHINMDAKKSFSLNVDGTAYIGASKHIIQQAERIDFNPYCEGQKSYSGYFGGEKINLVLERFKGMFSK